MMSFKEVAVSFLVGAISFPQTATAKSFEQFDISGMVDTYYLACKDTSSANDVSFRLRNDLQAEAKVLFDNLEHEGLCGSYELPASVSMQTLNTLVKEQPDARWITFSEDPSQGPHYILPLIHRTGLD